VPHGGLNEVPGSDGFDGAECLDLAAHWRNASFFAAPTMVRRFVEAARARPRRPDGLATIVHGGGPMFLADIEAALRAAGPHFAQICGQGERPMTITVLPRWVIDDAAQPRHAPRVRLARRGESPRRGPRFLPRRLLSMWAWRSRWWNCRSAMPRAARSPPASAAESACAAEVAVIGRRDGAWGEVVVRLRRAAQRRTQPERPQTRSPPRPGRPGADAAAGLPAPRYFSACQLQSPRRQVCCAFAETSQERRSMYIERVLLRWLCLLHSGTIHQEKSLRQSSTSTCAPTSAGLLHGTAAQVTRSLPV
jgi:hypothetical protein